MFIRIIDDIILYTFITLGIVVWIVGFPIWMLIGFYIERNFVIKFLSRTFFVLKNAIDNPPDNQCPDTDNTKQGVNYFNQRKVKK